ncbi:hypothetical protein AMS68_007185 [Peltaster fructicola]|uniref:BRCT domain-containing protein n=1 Tax=Peltaster fructicola TaxID=286661 RepID=A0A6H0Y499_9PEZI|nr:hypothetical protein AMS68_007185 [Peltaster fructicola]
MPPKKASQVHLVVLRNDTGETLEILDAYTTSNDAQSSIENHEVTDGLEVYTVDVKSSVEKPAATKKAASKAKAQPKKVKQEAEDDDDDDDDDEEQEEVNAKKAAGGKRKQIAQGQEGSLDGLKLLFTGTFTMDRKTCEATAVKHGATIVTQLKHADLIVLGTKPGPKKVAEIKDNGYKTVDEAGFNAMLQGEAAPKKTKT